MQAILSGVISIFYYAMVIAAVWKLFQVATDLSEIKALLTQMRQTAPAAASAPAIRPNPQTVAATAPTPAVPAPVSVPPVLSEPISLESAEALLREVAAESEALSAAERLKTTA
jgi:hypothetical protein